MDKKTAKLPSAAFQFLAPAGVSQPAENSTDRILTGIAYSGDVITDHGYWSRLVIDLETLSVETPIPLLFSHDHEKSVGMVITATTQAGNLGIEALLFTDFDDEAADIAAKADKGFPWQLSVGIWPNSIEDVPSGNAVIVNGLALQGPLTIFRGGRVREVSVCALGADHRTSATVLNAGDQFEIPIITTHEENTVSIEELKAALDEVKRENAELKANLESAKSQADEAKQALQALHAETRLSAIGDLAAKLNKEFSDDEMAQLKALPDAAFTFMSAQLSAAKPQPPEHLFHEQATGGRTPEADEAVELAAAQKAIFNQLKAGK